MTFSDANAGAGSGTGHYQNKFHQHSRSLSSEIVSVEGNESVEIHTDSDFDDSTNPRYSNYIYQEHGDDASFNIESDSDAESSRASRTDFSAYRNRRLESSGLRNSLLGPDDETQENEDDEEALTVAPLKLLPNTPFSHRDSNDDEEDDDDFFSLANSSTHSLDLESPSTKTKQIPLAFSSPVPSQVNSPATQPTQDSVSSPFEDQNTSASSHHSTHLPAVAISSTNFSQTGEPPVLLNSDTITTTTSLDNNTSVTPDSFSTTTISLPSLHQQEHQINSPLLHSLNGTTPSEKMQDPLDSQAPDIPFPTTSAVPAPLPKNLTLPPTVDPAKRRRKPSGVLTLAAKFEQEASTIISPTTPTTSTSAGQPSPPKGSMISSKVEVLEKMLSSQPPTPTLRTSASLNGINGISGNNSSSTSLLRPSASASGFSAMIAAAEGNSGSQTPTTFKNPNPILIPKAFEQANKSKESQKSSSSSENEELSASIVTERPEESDEEVDPLTTIKPESESNESDSPTENPLKSVPDQEQNSVETAEVETNKDTGEPETHKDIVEPETHKDAAEPETHKDVSEPETYKGAAEPEKDTAETESNEDAAESDTYKDSAEDAASATEPADQFQINTLASVPGLDAYSETEPAPTSNLWSTSPDLEVHEQKNDTTAAELPKLDDKETTQPEPNDEKATSRSTPTGSEVNAAAVSITPLANSTIATSAGVDEELLNAHERDDTLTQNVVGDLEGKKNETEVLLKDDENKENAESEQNEDTDEARARAPSFSLKPIEKDDFDDTNPNDKNLIFAVYVVGFHHIRGPEVEYAVGGEGQDHTKLWPNLPFQSLPDGSHSHEENFCYFSLLYDNKTKTGPIAVPVRDKHGNITEEVPDMSNTTTMFGISCNRQLKATDLKERPDDVTRSTVQKSVIVIARKPIFGAIREKLAVITRAYFQQGDFEDRSLIDSLYGNLVQMFAHKVDEGDLYVGMSLRELVHRLQSKVLFLLKALLLEKKIFFFGHNTEVLCASQFALVSLIPNLINNLEDCGSPLLKSYETRLKKPTSLRSSDRSSLLHYMGLPLQIFAQGGMFTAYVPLQQMDELKAPETKYFLVGSTNELLLAPQNCVADILVNIDQSSVEVLSHGLHNALALSSADKKWINSIVQAVEDTWDPEDPDRPKDLGFWGSEDYVRQQFEDYIMGLLSAVKYDRFLQRMAGSKQPNMRLREVNGNPIKQFNHHWIKEWRTTNNFRIFSKFTDDELFDIVEPRHMGVAPQPQPPQASSGSGAAATAPGSQETSQGAQGASTESSEAEGAKGPKAWNSFWWNKKEGEGPAASDKDGREESEGNAAGAALSPTRSNSSAVSSSQKSSRSVTSASTGIFSNWSLWGNNNHESKDDSSLSGPGASAPNASSAPPATQSNGFFARLTKS